jgi:type IV fimbrial biogenesis protein FimT
MKLSNRGFTLPELMVVLAIAAAILGIGVPNFRDFQRNNRLTVAANDTLGGVITSRAEALRRQVTISMCPSADRWPLTPHAVAAAAGSSSKIPTATVTVPIPRNSLPRAHRRRRQAATNSGCISFASTGFKRVVAGEPATSYIAIAMTAATRRKIPAVPIQPRAVSKFRRPAVAP